MKPAANPYDLTFEQREGYLYACIASPTITHVMALDYLSEIANRCAETRCKCLVIDRDIPAVMPTADALRAVAEFIRISKGVRTAFVNRHGSVGEALKAVIKTGADNGGDVCYFTTIPEAEEWLRAG